MEQDTKGISQQEDSEHEPIQEPGGDLILPQDQRPQVRKDKSKPSKRLGSARGTDAVALISATFNNTIVTVTDSKGSVLFWSSSGKQGFRGSKKSTPFSAQVVGEVIGRRALECGIKDLRVKVRGPGPGRESAIRALCSSGIKVLSLEDVTTVPHNGCKPPKRRRT